MNRFSSFYQNKNMGLLGTLVAGLSRVLPHPPNFTSAGAMTLFAGARMTGPAAWLVPALLMVVTDWILAGIHGYSVFSAVTPFVYGSLALNILLGRTLQNTENPLLIGGATLIASVQFFLVSNLGVWMVSGMYPMTGAGLMSSYVAALPFFGNTLLGDFVYSAVFFGLHAAGTRVFFASEQPSTAH